MFQAGLSHFSYYSYSCSYCSYSNIIITIQVIVIGVQVISSLSFAVTLFAEDNEWVRSRNYYLIRCLRQTHKKIPVSSWSTCLGNGKTGSVVESRKSNQVGKVTQGV